MVPAEKESSEIWVRTTNQVIDDYEIEFNKGLSKACVKKQRKRFGRNLLRKPEHKSTLQILLNQFKSLIVLLLLVATVVSALLGDVLEAIAIGIVILINISIGFFMELRAIRSMEALHQLGSTKTKVRREGQVFEIPAEQLVPGDVVIFQSGDVVTADLRLITSSRLQVNESALTGESVPVEKNTEPLKKEVALAERSNMVFKGTAVTRGQGEGIVVAIGNGTELGHISTLAESIEEDFTPLEKRLQSLGRKLIVVTLVLAAIVAVSGIIVGKDLTLMLKTAIALAIATIPEGLPIVATIALARGMWRMANQNALINRLSSVETLGATTVICTDKTGTLTENQMTVTMVNIDAESIQITGEGLEVQGEFRKGEHPIDPKDHPPLWKALKVSALCNNARWNNSAEEEQDPIGDPTEIALLIAAQKAGLNREHLLQELPEIRQNAFDVQTKAMATYHQEDAHILVAVKGAPESILNASTTIMTSEESHSFNEQEREAWKSKASALAEKGLRVLATATKTIETKETEPYTNLTFLALIGLIDPPRKDVQEAIKETHTAGIRIIMVTGDHPATARKIAYTVGLIENEKTEVSLGKSIKPIDEYIEEEKIQILETPIFARVTPEQKLHLVELHQERGAILAMTGDGVNDAPALQKADIGIAMGQRGTQVAKEAADMVLEDDAFHTIVLAIRQGRVIFNNIKKFVIYLLSCNFSEILVIALGILLNLPLLLIPIQILFLNILTDVFPALALGVGKGDPEIMKRLPRNPQAPMLNKRNWISLASYSFIITVFVLLSYWIGLFYFHFDQAILLTMAFVTLAFAQLWHVFNMREPRSNFFKNDVTTNRYVWLAIIVCVSILIIAIYLPPLAIGLELVPIAGTEWIIVLSLSLMPLLFGILIHAIETRVIICK